MSRNSSGSYTLPVGNPVTTGTTISSTWANATLTDLATEMTDSLSRSGKGAMTGALQLANGSATVPGLTFTGDTNTGFYRSGVDTFSATAGGVEAFAFSNDTNTSALPLKVSSGSAGKAGVGFITAPGTGMYLVSGVPTFKRDDADTTKSALGIAGTLDVSGQSDLASTTAVGNLLVKERIPRCWGYVGTDGVGGVGVGGSGAIGHNIASASLPANDTMRVTFAQPMADVNYAIIRNAAIGTTGVNGFARVMSRTTTYFEVKILDSSGTAQNLATLACNIEFIVFGRQ